uniref:Uncharacterized protein n=1 Tax=Arundo donax TaxID=35708 RepID=A0A0A8Y1X2_ARUDO
MCDLGLVALPLYKLVRISPLFRFVSFSLPS